MDTLLSFTSISTKDVISTNAYKPFRRNKQGRRGGGVALGIREGSDCLHLMMATIGLMCLQERGKSNKTDGPPNQGEEVDKLLGEVTLSVVLVLVEGLQLARHLQETQPSREERVQEIPECGKEAFLTQLMSEPAREGTSRGLFFVNRGGLVGDALLEGCLGHSDHKMMSFQVSEKESVEQPAWTFRGQGLAYLGMWLPESLWWHS